MTGFCLCLFRFLNSEIELNSCLSWFIGLGTAGLDVLRPLAVNEDSLKGFYLNLLPLLEHPNTDIGNKVVEIFHEIFHDEEGFQDEEEFEIVSQLAINCLTSDLFLFFCIHIQNLMKAGKSDDSDDSQAIFQIFQIVEDILNLFHQPGRDDSNVIEFYNRLTVSNIVLTLIEMFKQDPKVVKTDSWSAILSPSEYSNRLYATELCATIFQLSAMDLKHPNALVSEAVNKLWITSIEGLMLVESLLISISVYRGRDPKDSDEQEYLFNLFDCLAALLLNSSVARNSFASDQCQGFDLFLMLLKEINIARIRAIQIVDYVLASEDTSHLAVKFINSGGLKLICPILMGKGTSKLIKCYPKLLLSLDQDESHACAIVASLFKNTPCPSSAYFRLITKFVEGSGEKFSKLVEIHKKYAVKLADFDRLHGIKRKIDEDEWILDRINAGLFVLHQVDVSLLILCNSTTIIGLIRNNSDSQAEISEDLFAAVEDELPKLDCSSVFPEIVENVKDFLRELDAKTTIPIVPLLKTFIQ